MGIFIERFQRVSFLSSARYKITESAVTDVSNPNPQTQKFDALVCSPEIGSTLACY